MDGQAEVLLQLGLNIAGTPVGPFMPTLLNVRQDLRRKLVALLGPAPLGQQAGQSGRFKRRVRGTVQTLGG
jgi:hypothetical protein